jgi:plasmid stabilization system protein ParE
MARYRIRYRLAAVEELEEAIDWYSRRDPAVGQRLRATVREKIVDVRAHPLACAADPDGVRLALVKPFPYHIVYRVNGLSSRSWRSLIRVASQVTGGIVCSRSSEVPHV